jgi:hypothetical protein
MPLACLFAPTIGRGINLPEQQAGGHEVPVWKAVGDAPDLRVRRPEKCDEIANRHR